MAKLLQFCYVLMVLMTQICGDSDHAGSDSSAWIQIASFSAYDAPGEGVLQYMCRDDATWLIPWVSVMAQHKDAWGYALAYVHGCKFDYAFMYLYMRMDTHIYMRIYVYIYVCENMYM